LHSEVLGAWVHKCVGLFAPGVRKTGNSSMSESGRKRKRVETVTDAALYLGISRQRLQEIRRTPAPWWQDEMATDAGFDVVGIALAQAAWHHQEQLKKLEAETPRTEFDERMQAAALLEAEEAARVKQLDRQKRERLEQQAAGELVRVEVVRSLLREALGELRRGLDDLPWVFSRQVSPEFADQCYTVEIGKAQAVSDLAPLQRAVMKVVEQYQRYLDRIPAEVFEESQVDLDPPADSQGTEAADVRGLF